LELFPRCAAVPVSVRYATNASKRHPAAGRVTGTDDHGCRQGSHRLHVGEARPSRVGVAIAERQCSASIDGKYHLIESRVIWKSFLREPGDDRRRIQ
jgi:hypothetical protein